MRPIRKGNTSVAAVLLLRSLSGVAVIATTAAFVVDADFTAAVLSDKAGASVAVVPVVDGWFWGVVLACVLAALVGVLDVVVCVEVVVVPPVVVCAGGVTAGAAKATVVVDDAPFQVFAPADTILEFDAIPIDADPVLDRLLNVAVSASMFPLSTVPPEVKQVCPLVSPTLLAKDPPQLVPISCTWAAL